MAKIGSFILTSRGPQLKLEIKEELVGKMIQIIYKVSVINIPALSSVG